MTGRDEIVAASGAEVRAAAVSNPNCGRVALLQHNRIRVPKAFIFLNQGDEPVVKCNSSCG